VAAGRFDDRLGKERVNGGLDRGSDDHVEGRLGRWVGWKRVGRT